METEWNWCPEIREMNFVIIIIQWQFVAQGRINHLLYLILITNRKHATDLSYILNAKSNQIHFKKKFLPVYIIYKVVWSQFKRILHFWKQNDSFGPKNLKSYRNIFQRHIFPHKINIRLTGGKKHVFIKSFNQFLLSLP